jgi:hypothetical protein
MLKAMKLCNLVDQPVCADNVRQFAGLEDAGWIISVQHHITIA